MSTSDELESVDEPILRQFHPKPFRWDAVNPEKIVISYDRRSDTLLVHLFGRGRSSVSVHIDRYLYAMVDPESEEIIGIHIEGFLSQAVKEHPQEVAILDHAELRGITPVEVRALQREVLGSPHQLPKWYRAALAPKKAQLAKHGLWRCFLPLKRKSVGEFLTLRLRKYVYEAQGDDGPGA